MVPQSSLEENAYVVLLLIACRNRLDFRNTWKINSDVTEWFRKPHFANRSREAEREEGGEKK